MADLSNVVRMLIHQLDATRSYLLPSYCDEDEKARAVIAFAESALAAGPPAPAEPVATLHVSDFRGYENYDFQHLVDLPPGHYKLFTACTTQPPAPAPAADGERDHVPGVTKMVLATDDAARLRQCPTHGQLPANAWACPECLRELREELARLRGSTPPADGEVEELAQWLRVAAVDEGGFSYTRLNRAAALLREAMAVDQKTKELITAVQVTYSAYGWVPEKHFIRLFDDVARLASALEEGCDCSIQEPLNWETEILELKARPRPVPVAERPWERPGWCDAEGECWWQGRDPAWWTKADPRMVGAGWLLPHWAIPQPPQGGEVGQ